MWVIDTETVTEDTDLPTRVGWTSNDFKEGTDLPYFFRMLDADDEVYYTGRSDVDDFAPLDDLGTPDAGAITIEYLQPDGTWEAL